MSLPGCPKGEFRSAQHEGTRWGAVVDIDGAHGEGGGQFVRLAVAISAVNGVPVRLAGIRDDGVIRPHMVMTYQPTFSSALIGHIEAVQADDEMKRQQCRPAAMTDTVEACLQVMAAALAAEEWLCDPRREVAAETLRALGAPEPRRITECESFSAMHTLLADSDMLAVVQHPFLDMPQVAADIQEIPIAQRNCRAAGLGHCRPRTRGATKDRFRQQRSLRCRT